MNKNVGGVDAMLRGLVGGVMIGLALFAPAGSGWHMWGWIGVVPLLTALVGFCPAYPLVGMNTCGCCKK